MKSAKLIKMETIAVKRLHRGLLAPSDDGWTFEALQYNRGFCIYKNRKVKYALAPAGDGTSKVRLIVKANQESVRDLGLVSAQEVQEAKTLIKEYIKDLRLPENVDAETGEDLDDTPDVIWARDHKMGRALKLLVLKALHLNLCEVVFKKADDSKRRMLGTLLPTFMPEDGPQPPSPATIHRRENNPYLITVWDVEKLEFRSFTLARLIKLSVV